MSNAHLILKDLFQVNLHKNRNITFGVCFFKTFRPCSELKIIQILIKGILCTNHST